MVIVPDHIAQERRLAQPSPQHLALMLEHLHATTAMAQALLWQRTYKAEEAPELAEKAATFATAIMERCGFVRAEKPTGG